MAGTEDFVGAAECILESFECKHPDIALCEDGSAYDVQEFALHLEAYFDFETVEELLETGMGRGILLGMVMVYRGRELGYDERDD